MAYNLLIVDDSRVMRQTVARGLQMSGLPIGELHEAANGKDALSILDRAWVDVVFADLHMPVMDGMEMIDRLRQDPALADLPVVVVSSDPSEARREELYRKGVRFFIRKPFTSERWREVVKYILEELHHGSDHPEDV